MYFNRRFFLASATGATLLCPTLSKAQSRDVATGIIFVGASWCPVCKKASPLLKVFSERNRIPIIVASRDDRPITPFETFVPASTHPIAMSVTRLPTTLVYSEKLGGVVGSFEGYRTPVRYLNNLVSLVRESEAIV